MITDAAALLRDYLDAGLRMDIDQLDRTYAPEFTNVRVDLAGRTFRLSRAELLATLRSRAALGQMMPAIDDVRVLATSYFGTHATVVFRRVKQGQPLIYTFVWDLSADPATLVQEITTHTRLPLEMRPVRRSRPVRGALRDGVDPYVDEAPARMRDQGRCRQEVDELEAPADDALTGSGSVP